MKEETYNRHCLVVDEYLVNGMNGTQAYLKFYPNVSENTAAVNFKKILSNTKIDDYLKSKLQNKAVELDLSLNKLLMDLENDKGAARKSKQFASAIKATEVQAKLLGYTVDKKEINVTEGVKTWLSTFN